ncbi:hypothetical protein [Streptomyces incanus]|uniref:Uncharacterized protein n=1 Tax=Streptomyces incanus TaxID=887453 RepID=A0ABW0XTW9_9ACTN
MPVTRSAATLGREPLDQSAGGNFGPLDPSGGSLPLGLGDDVGGAAVPESQALNLLKSESGTVAVGHPAAMSQTSTTLSVVAIVVATLSAIFTGLNMTFSALTYRRVRPKVEVLEENWGVWEPDGGYDFSLRLANRSTTPIGVESVSVIGSHGHRRNDRFVRRKEFEKPEEVAALSGIVVSIPLPTSLLIIDGKVPRYITAMVRLTDGRVIRTSFKDFPRLLPEDRLGAAAPVVKAPPKR